MKGAGNRKFNIKSKRIKVFAITIVQLGVWLLQAQGVPYAACCEYGRRLGVDTFSHDRQITGIVFYQNTLMSHGMGSDQWPLTWGKDGNIYSAWGDGRGWIKQKSEPKSFMGITVIRGTPPDVKGIDIWQENNVNRKPLALIALQENLYLFYDKKSDNWDGSYVAVSEDNGRTWEFNDNNPLFTLAGNDMKIVGIAQFGPGYTGLPGNVDKRFFYIYLSDRTDGKKADGRDIWLARVRPGQILRQKAYEFFTGIHKGHPGWSNNAHERVAVLQDEEGMGYHVSVSFNKPLHRFLLAKSSQINHLGIWKGASPWGPWFNIFNKKFLDDHWKFTYMIPPKWMGANGRTLWMTFSGWPEEDRINFIRAKLSLEEN